MRERRKLSERFRLLAYRVVRQEGKSFQIGRPEKLDRLAMLLLQEVQRALEFQFKLYAVLEIYFLAPAGFG